MKTTLMCLQTIKINNSFKLKNKTKTSIQCRSKIRKTGPGKDGMWGRLCICFQEAKITCQNSKKVTRISLPKSTLTISQIFKHLNQPAEDNQEIGINKMKALQIQFYGYLSIFFYSLLPIQNTRRAHKTLNNESMDFSFFSMLKTSISKNWTPKNFFKFWHTSTIVKLKFLNEPTPNTKKSWGEFCLNNVSTRYQRTKNDGYWGGLYKRSARDKGGRERDKLTIIEVDTLLPRFWEKRTRTSDCCNIISSSSKRQVSLKSLFNMATILDRQYSGEKCKRVISNEPRQKKKIIFSAYKTGLKWPEEG